MKLRIVSSRILIFCFAILTSTGATWSNEKKLKGNAKFTLYFVAEVTEAKSKGIEGKVQTIDGHWIKYRLSKSDNKKANMEGTVSSKGPDGEVIISSISRIGVWKDLPYGWLGKGNRQNPLHAYRTVAADQKHYPYGSRIFDPGLKGYKTPDGHEHDGYLWVADTGGRIKGALRFDIFVGHEVTYKTLKKIVDTKWNAEVTVEPLPKPPAKWNPKELGGLKNTLKKFGCDINQKNAVADKNQAKKKLIGSVKNITAELKSCLMEFQTKHSGIPETEHGIASGAITLWYLTAAAMSYQRGKKYGVE